MKKKKLLWLNKWLNMSEFWCMFFSICSSVDMATNTLSFVMLTFVEVVLHSPLRGS